MTTNQTAPVTDEELDQMILKLERDGGMTPKMLSLMRELREVRRAKGDGRDQFEEWFKFHHGEEGSIIHLHRANGGANYADPHVDLAWIAWKDSRAAMLNHSGDTADMGEPVSNRDELPFEQWLSQQSEKIDVDCGCISIEAFMCWMRKAYEAGNSSATPDGWIPVSERMPEHGVDVLACKKSPFGGYEEIETAQWHGGMKGVQPVFITSADTIEPEMWQPLPAAPKEVG